MAKLVRREYRLPFILVTSLFFLWGFARAIMDVLNKHFQAEMDISISQSTLVQGAFFLGYFLFAIPAGLLIGRRGYRYGMVFGLLLFGAGALTFGLLSMGFDGSGSLQMFYVFLVALFVMACGLVFLETAANPYMARLGDAETSASRLNLAQSINGLGNICGPWIGGAILFSGAAGANISGPYIFLAVMVCVFALAFTRVRLPEIVDDDELSAEVQGGEAGGSLLHNGMFVFGFIALLFYEIAEIAINSLFINYAERVSLIDNMTASRLLSFGFFLFMCARFVGGWVMSRIAAQKVLLFCAAGTVVANVLVLMELGTLSMVALILNYALEAIMFPTIFSLALRGLGSQTKRASAYLMMSTIGGAIGTMLMGMLADRVTLSFSFIVPVVGYAVVLLYSWRVNTVISGHTPKRNGSPT